MIATPRELLDTSIAQLQLLTAFLGDQLADRAVETKKGSGAPEIRACREILVSLGALIVKVQAISHLTSGRVTTNQVRASEGCTWAHTSRGECGRSARAVRQLLKDVRD